ncbi:hypothetical protein RUM43_004846, partial [Polyplax serrata]
MAVNSLQETATDERKSTVQKCDKLLGASSSWLLKRKNNKLSRAQRYNVTRVKENDLSPICY